MIKPRHHATGRHLAAAVLLTVMAPATAAEGSEPRFEAQTIDDNIRIGYGLGIGDVNGNGLDDILLADARHIVIDIIAAGRATRNVVIYWNRSGAD